MNMGDEEECSTGLCLGLAVGAAGRRGLKDNNNNTFMAGLDLSCKEEADDVDTDHKITEEDEFYTNKNRFDSSSNNGGRKKLRLTKDQSGLLEDTFKLHTTLNSTQKHALADQLNLKPRQVEVWFQNRRARTKLKQTEIDCEILKKCCERLSDENKRLKKELQQLRSVNAGASPLIIQFQEGRVCPSCEKIMRAK